MQNLITQFQKRLLTFSVDIFRLLESVPYSDTKKVIAYQLGKSASSVGANFRAFCRGRSNNEKFSKICIVVEEADETEYWLAIMAELKLGELEERKRLQKEIDEIIRVTVSIKNKLWK
ncbi:MAG: four helix bundle protein [Bacteroidota bacterium]